MDENPQPGRRWFRFSLRGMLVGLTLLAVLSAWMGHRRRTLELETILRSAQMDLERSQVAQRQVPNVISQLEMRRLELVRDHAQLNVDRANSIPVWHRDELRDLDRRLAAVKLEILEIELEQAEVTSAQNHEHHLELMRRITALRSELAQARQQLQPTGT
jgi:hypothetical protein